MFRNFSEIEKYILDKGFKATVALAGSNDIDTLSSVVNAKRKGIIKAVLIGDEDETRALLNLKKITDSSMKKTSGNARK